MTKEVSRPPMPTVSAAETATPPHSRPDVRDALGPPISPTRGLRARLPAMPPSFTGENKEKPTPELIKVTISMKISTPSPIRTAASVVPTSVVVHQPIQRFHQPIIGPRA